MRPSRGMGAIMPDKMPKGKKNARRDDTDFTEYKEGGDVKMAGGGLYANIAAKKRRIAAGSGEKMRSVGSKGAPKKGDFANAAKTASYKEGGKVNAAGNYTKPGLRKHIFNSVKAAATHGTGAGQWSARKAQLVAKKYKAAGGGYK
jgi:hypothetical protein